MLEFVSKHLVIWTNFHGKNIQWHYQTKDLLMCGRVSTFHCLPHTHTHTKHKGGKWRIASLPQNHLLLSLFWCSNLIFPLLWECVEDVFIQTLPGTFCNIVSLLLCNFIFEYYEDDVNVFTEIFTSVCLPGWFIHIEFVKSLTCWQVKNCGTL